MYGAFPESVSSRMICRDTSRSVKDCNSFSFASHFGCLVFVAGAMNSTFLCHLHGVAECDFSWQYLVQIRMLCCSATKLWQGRRFGRSQLCVAILL